jgi:hypothetical protein
VIFQFIFQVEYLLFSLKKNNNFHHIVKILLKLVFNIVDLFLYMYVHCLYDACFACHMHENNQDYNFLNKNKSKSDLILNLNHETKKKQKHETCEIKI